MLDKSIVTPSKPEIKQPQKQKVFHRNKYIWIAAIVFVVILVSFGFLVYTTAKSKGVSIINLGFGEREQEQQEEQSKKAEIVRLNEGSSELAKFGKIPRPKFSGIVSPDKSSEYKLLNPLPKTEELLSKIPSPKTFGFARPAYAEDRFVLPVYKVRVRDIIGKDEASDLAKRLGFVQPPVTINHPAGPEFRWESSDYKLSIGSYSVYYEPKEINYYPYVFRDKSYDAPNKIEAVKAAKKFLDDRGLTPKNLSRMEAYASCDTYGDFCTGAITKVNFFERVGKFRLIDHRSDQGTSKEANHQVWVGKDLKIDGLIISYYDPKQDLNTKSNYPIKDISQVWGDFISGKGVISHLFFPHVVYYEYGDGIDEDMSTYGSIKNVRVDSVELSYYWGPWTGNSEDFIQPIYVFKGKANFYWKDSYTDWKKFEGLLSFQESEPAFIIYVPAIDEDYLK